MVIPARLPRRFSMRYIQLGCIARPCSDTHRAPVSRAIPSLSLRYSHRIDIAASPMGIHLSFRPLPMTRTAPPSRSTPSRSNLAISLRRPGVSHSMYSTARLRTKRNRWAGVLVRAGSVSTKRSRIWSSDTTGTVFSSRRGGLIRCRGLVPT